MAKKKKQALDNLLNNGRISQPTHELFNKEIDEAVAEIEKQQKALLEKMNSKMKEIEDQIKTLEMLFADFEIQHVTGEVDEESYQREMSLLSIGLETAKHELDVVKEAVNQLSTGIPAPAPDASVQKEAEPQPPQDAAVSQPEVEKAEEPVSTVEEKSPEPQVEQVEAAKTESFQAPQENPQGQLQSTGESQSTETKAEGEQKA